MTFLKLPGTFVSMQPREPALGAAIRRARERKRMTQQELADAVGVTSRTIGNWETGHRLPKNRLGALEEVLGISLGGEAQGAEPELIPEDKWETRVLSDPGLPYAERVQIIRIARKARADLYPAAPGPRPAGDARAPQAQVHAPGRTA